MFTERRARRRRRAAPLRRRPSRVPPARTARPPVASASPPGGGVVHVVLGRHLERAQVCQRRGRRERRRRGVPAIPLAAARQLHERRVRRQAERRAAMAGTSTSGTAASPGRRRGEHARGLAGAGRRRSQARRRPRAPASPRGPIRGSRARRRRPRRRLFSAEERRRERRDPLTGSAPRGRTAVMSSAPGIGEPCTLRTRGAMRTDRPHCSVPSTRTAVYSSTGSPRRAAARTSAKSRSPSASAFSRACSSPFFHSQRSSCHLHSATHTALGLSRNAAPSHERQPALPAEPAPAVAPRRRRGRPRETSGRDRPRGGTGERGVERRAGDGTPGRSSRGARARAARRLGREPSHRVSTRRVRHGRLAARRAQIWLPEV